MTSCVPIAAVLKLQRFFFVNFYDDSPNRFMYVCEQKGIFLKKLFISEFVGTCAVFFGPNLQDV